MHLSPSLVHQRLMADLVPSHRYEGGNVPAWQARLRPRLAEVLGYDQMPAERAPLNPRILWEREHALGRIQKIAFTSEPQADVVGYFCLPRQVLPPLPVMICLQGHTTGMHNSIAVSAEDELTPIKVNGDRDFALGCMRRGYAALAIEQRSFGERREKTQTHTCKHNGCHDAAMHALMLGRTLAAERVYDVDRAIDYLLTRPEIDPKRIGVMGNSGGGTISIYAGALLERLSAMMPSCSFCTYRESIMSIYHCGDNYIPGLLRVAENADVVGLFAPRPVVIVAGQTDGIFPIDGVRRAFADLQRIYAAAGALDNCRLVIGPEGHRFYADLAWPVFEAVWIHR